MKKIVREQRKGQAAMEFLMTYGWAILAAIIAIGVLAYFGVFSPSRLAGPAGLVGPPFNLDDFNINNDDTNGDYITMIVTQNLGESITLSTTTADGSGSATDGFAFILPDGTACAISDTGSIIDATTPGAWTSGTQVTITATCATDAWASGDAVRGDITIRYASSGGLAQVSQGNLRGTSQ